jgi:hypothetical protein
MRPFPLNSPQAAARLVGLILIADGMASAKEFGILRQLDAGQRLGLANGELELLLQQLCEDLQQQAEGCWSGQALITTEELDGYLVEVTDAGLRETVLALSLAVAEADAHLSDGECMLLAHTMWRWKLHQACLLPGTPLGRHQQQQASVF